MKIWTSTWSSFATGLCNCPGWKKLHEPCCLFAVFLTAPNEKLRGIIHGVYLKQFHELTQRFVIPAQTETSAVQVSTLQNNGDTKLSRKQLRSPPAMTRALTWRNLPRKNGPVSCVKANVLHVVKQIIWQGIAQRRTQGSSRQRTQTLKANDDEGDVLGRSFLTKSFSGSRSWGNRGRRIRIRKSNQWSVKWSSHTGWFTSPEVGPKSSEITGQKINGGWLDSSPRKN